MFIVITAMFVTVDVRRRGLRGRQRRTRRCRSRTRSASPPTPSPRPASATTSSACARTRTCGRSAQPRRAPNPTEKSPINQQWDGVGTDPRIWRKIPGVAGGVHDRAAAHRQVHEVRDGGEQAGLDDRHVQRHVPDPHHGPRDRGPAPPSARVIVTFKREGFLKFVYFTDQENRDPQAATTSVRAHHAAGQVRQPATARRARARAAWRSSSPPATRSTGRCTPTTRTC